MPYRAALLCTARRLTRREADAEDLIQDTMMNAFLGFDRFQPGTNLRAGSVPGSGVSDGGVSVPDVRGPSRESLW
ncbi:sigma factor [Mycobacterium avium]|uniref:sigma factor n=1 Tax=Mycobacterium avium TaxID=1764 RepID=UPI0020CFF600|nr:sigma factor [Mycobacterium avium]